MQRKISNSFWATGICHDDDVILRPANLLVSSCKKIMLFVQNLTCFCALILLHARTKVYMSDENYVDPPLLYLPAAVCWEIQQSGSIPEGKEQITFIVCELCS